MNFNEFVENVVKILQEKMGEDYEIKVTNVTKNNDIQLTGVIMMRETDKISPTIYLEEPYRQYSEGTGLHEITDRIVAYNHVSSERNRKEMDKLEKIRLIG